MFVRPVQELVIGYCSFRVKEKFEGTTEVFVGICDCNRQEGKFYAI